MSKINEENIKKIGLVLIDPDRPLKERFRALFTLKSIGGPVSLNCIAEAFKDDSALLKHEVAYCLGQMGNLQANEVLVTVLEDRKQEAIVRHEAAEALGAIGSSTMKKYLEKYAQEQEEDKQEVRETCVLALERLSWLEGSKNDGTEDNVYGSTDPAPPLDSTSSTHSIVDLKSILLDPQRSLFLRYRAMFALRNISSSESSSSSAKEALLSLCEALALSSSSSALFRHEVAFVLGQLQHPASVPALVKCLETLEENEMVRHEAAEALGAIATQECLEVLQRYLNDGKRVVRESCEIALDMCEYEQSPEFQYANTLLSL